MPKDKFDPLASQEQLIRDCLKVLHELKEWKFVTTNPVDRKRYEMDIATTRSNLEDLLANYFSMLEASKSEIPDDIKMGIAGTPQYLQYLEKKNKISTSETNQTISKPVSEQVTSSSYDYDKPFLLPSDRELINQTLVKLINRGESMRTLLYNSRIHEDWINFINFNAASGTQANNILERLEPVGWMKKPTETHFLGAFLEKLAEKSDYKRAFALVAIIFRYDLIPNLERLQDLSQTYQVPLPPDHDKIVQTSQTNAQLESLYQAGRARYVKPDFLIKGADAIRSVCRLAFRRQPEGTGFLVAPDLILTNYHVMKPPEYTGTLEDRAAECEVQFGVMENSSSKNLKFSLHPTKWKRAESLPHELDFILLKLEHRVENDAKILPLTVKRPPRLYPPEPVNIIHHPLGGTMQVSLRFNQVEKIEQNRIFYLADIEKGSSGAPVFNDDWQVVGLHCAGNEVDKTGRILSPNWGVPIQLILDKIEAFLLY